MCFLKNAERFKQKILKISFFVLFTFPVLPTVRCFWYYIKMFCSYQIMRFFVDKNRKCKWPINKDIIYLLRPFWVQYYKTFFALCIYTSDFIVRFYVAFLCCIFMLHFLIAFSHCVFSLHFLIAFSHCVFSLHFLIAFSHCVFTSHFHIAFASENALNTGFEP